jgi:DNA modification methylase
MAVAMQRSNEGGATFLVGEARALSLRSETVALVVTSPPYFNGRDYSTWPTYADYLADMAAAWAEAGRVLCPGRRLAVNVPMGYGRPSTGGYLPIGDDTARHAGGRLYTARTYHLGQDARGPGDGLGELVERPQPEPARLP